MTIIVSDVLENQLEQIENLEKILFSSPWTFDQLHRQMTGDNTVFLVATDEKANILGYVGMSFVLDEGYISNVATSPDFRRLGIADRLISELENRSKALHLAFLTLEVRESNAPAIALYKKHGFMPLGNRKNYYEKPKENAVLMTFFFNNGDNLC